MKARCACGRLLPIYDVEVSEGPRKRFGLHSDQQGNYCPRSDSLLDVAVVEVPAHRLT